MLAPFHLIVLLVVAVVILPVHFLPAILAYARKAKSFWWIFAINFFLGWTFIGWVIALVWALRDEPKANVAVSV